MVSRVNLRVLGLLIVIVLGFDFKYLFPSKLLYKNALAEAARGDSASSRKRASTNVALCLPCRGSP